MAVSRWKMLQIFFPQVCFNCFTMFRTSAGHLTFHVKELERLHRIIHCLGRSAVSPSSHMSHPIPIPWLNPKCKKKQQIRLMEIIFSPIFPIIFLGQLVVLSALGASLQAALARILKFYPLAIHYSSSIVGYASTISYWLSIC